MGFKKDGSVRKVQNLLNYVKSKVHAGSKVFPSGGAANNKRKQAELDELMNVGAFLKEHNNDW